MGRPAIRVTSRARMTRRVLRGSIRAAPAGSRRRSQRAASSPPSWARAWRRRGWGDARDAPAFDHGFYVLPGAAHQNRQPAALLDGVDGGVGALLVFAQGDGLPRPGDVDEVVGDGGALGRRGFGRANVHTLVKQARIGGDNLAGKAAGQLQGEAGLAAGCGTNQHQQGWRAGISGHGCYHPGSALGMCSQRSSLPALSSSTATRSMRQATSSISFSYR